ncbi:MAG TPA: chromosomal replication initiator protein DnaA [Prevotellaceae bacterium]|nr:chromosomal replication initiator protein DnaA [Prevotellaceae bacterium]HBE55933.1 chromosomal replication initiator protein DnaA [Prevotellaceae bacterium]
MDKTPRDKWKECLGIIRNNVDERQFATWFEPTRFKAYDPEERKLTIYIPSNFFYEYLESHFRRLLHMTVAKVFGADQHLSYEVRVAGRETVNVESDEPTPLDRQARDTSPANQSPRMAQAAGMAQDLDSRLNMKQNFGNFIEGMSNKLPRSIGLSIAENPSQQTFNPFFIYGPSGVGKTHLVNAIGTRMKELHPEKRVLYLSARLFEVQYTSSVGQNRVNDFMHFYQSIDMLIIDDIQEMVGKKATQYTFFHIFNHLRQNGRHIILTSDRPPLALQGMEDRMITRFQSGLLAELEKPEERLRRDILESKVKHDGLKIPEKVIDYISQNVSDSVRELEGVVQSLLAYSVVFNRDVDLQFAMRIMNHNAHAERKRAITMDQIVEHACEYFQIRQEDVYGKSRKANIVLVRQLSMYLAQHHTQLTASKIGTLVGGRNHATVIHSVRTIENRLKSDKDFQKKVSELEGKLKA